MAACRAVLILGLTLALAACASAGDRPDSKPFSGAYGGLTGGGAREPGSRP